MIGVFGDINLDISAKIKRFPRPDDEVYIHEIKQVLGGTGANTAVAINRLGRETMLIGAVGDDHEGETLLKKMHDEGLKAAVREIPGKHTGYCFAAFDDKGNRRLFSYRGANLAYEMDEDALDIFRKCSMIHVTGGYPEFWEVMKTMIEAGALKATFSFDPGSMSCEAWPQQVLRFSETVDLLFISMNEVKILGEKHLLLPDTLRILKMGADGGIVYRHDKRIAKWNAIRRRQVDSTAAGDVFNAGVITGLDMALSIDESLRIGAVAAAISVTRAGAQSSIPNLEEVRKLYAEVYGSDLYARKGDNS